LHAHGHMDFFAKPSPTMVADFTLRDATLAPVAPAARQFGLTVGSGTLAAEGRLIEEQAGSTLALRRVEIAKTWMDYTHSGGPANRPHVRVAREAAHHV